MSSSWWTLIRSRLPDPVGGFILPEPERYTSKPTSAAVRGFNMQLQVCTDGLQRSFIKEKRLWNSLTLRSKFFRLWLSLWVPVSVSGALSTCWKVTATTTPAPMLMYGKEASNRKQEIDRQHHTIPNQRKQRPKDKHCGNVHNRLWNHG